MDCKVKVDFLNVKTALSQSGLPDLDYALNPYVGCQHGCIYCYAPNYVTHESVKANWGKIVMVKENIYEVLQSEVRRKRRGTVGVGTVTDAYQPIEALYGLTRSSLRTLLRNGFKVSIQTKSTLIVRDIDIFLKFKSQVDIGVTITVLDNSKAKLIEPCSSPPTERLRALKMMSGIGLKTWLFVGPLIDFRDDKFERDMEKLLSEAGSYVEKIYYDRMRLKPSIYVLNEPYRLLLIRSALNRDRLIDIVERLCDKLGLNCTPAFGEVRHNRLGS